MDNNIPVNQKFISINELKLLGYSYYKINKLVENDYLNKLNNSMYENTQFEGDDNDFYYVDCYIPSGVICLMSAAVYYNLSTDIPRTIDVAIHRKKNISTLPNWPSISLHYFSKNRFETGVQILKQGSNKFQIYDIEKTVIDIIYSRNEIGITETKEIIQNYLNFENRNINKLIRYSENLKCKKILNTYLEVLL